MALSLSRHERKRLIKTHKQSKDVRTRDRIKAVLAHDEGISNTEIAKILLVDDETVRRHIKDYSDEKKLTSTNGGSESELSETDAESLIEHLKEHTYLYVKDICHYVQNAYGYRYSVSGMTKWLKQYKFCYKKPHKVPAKADKARQAAFIEGYEKLKAECLLDGGHIYFGDCSHPQHQTELTYGWIYKGERKGIATTARQRRVNMIGAINLNGHRLISQHVEDKTINYTHILTFLKALRKRHDDNGTIHLIVDGAGYHKHKKVAEEAELLNIKLHYLPPYSPNLNPAERIWKLMHEMVRYNRYYETFDEFKTAIIDFFKTIGRKKKILRSRINDNFQKLTDINFAF
jgi:transposase